jgi:hypothetical protein
LDKQAFCWSLHCLQAFGCCACAPVLALNEHTSDIKMKVTVRMATSFKLLVGFMILNECWVQ